MQRQVLFLDIDGVLVASGDPPVATRFFSKTCRAHLLTLISQLPDLRIVITSSYRLGSGYERLLKLWREDALPDRIIDRTPHLGDKGAEIMAWLEEARLAGDPFGSPYWTIMWSSSCPRCPLSPCLPAGQPRV